jgi:hypothetical protein
MREFLRAANLALAVAAALYVALRAYRTYAARLYWRDIDPYIGANQWVWGYTHACSPTYTGGNGHPYNTVT